MRFLRNFLRDILRNLKFKVPNLFGNRGRLNNFSKIILLPLCATLRLVKQEILLLFFTIVLL